MFNKLDVLSDLVSFLSKYVTDARCIPKSDILLFAKEQGIALRDDHLHFLEKFGCNPEQHLKMFTKYRGYYDFDSLKRITLEKFPEMEVPSGTAYFGSDMIGSSFCIEYETGCVYEYEESEKFGLMHESINGFLLSRMLSVYDDLAFSKKLVRRYLDTEFIPAFRINNISFKLAGATSFAGNYDIATVPEVVEEFYFIDEKLIALFPRANSLIEYSDPVR